MTIAFLYIFFVVLPVFFWLWFFRWKDQAEPEPYRLILVLFFLGFVAALIASFAEELIMPYDMDEAMNASSNGTGKAPLILIVFGIMAGVIEELTKFGILRWYVYYKSSFNQIADGVIYAVTLAMGFALLENTLYFFSTFYYLQDFITWFYVIMMRAIMPLLMHIVSTGIMGLYIGRKKFTCDHKKTLLMKGFLIAIFLHCSYNSILFLLDPKFALIAGAILIIVFLLYLLREMSKDQSLMVWRLVRKGVST